MTQLYIGLMSGTSLDGVDIAIVDFNQPKPHLISSHCLNYPDRLLQNIKRLCRNTSISFDDFGQLDAQLGEFYGQSIIQCLTKANVHARDIVAIGSHGQTVQHSPSTEPAYTVQIGDPNRIAEVTGISVVADFRRRDIAAGGQGAPLAPAFHQALFQNSHDKLAVINIGGIANLTFLSTDIATPIIGFDCGPGNTLMDQWCQLHFNCAFDNSGLLAGSGTVNHSLLNSMLTDPYFTSPYPKTTGPEHFNITWLTAHLTKHPATNQDTLSTLCELTAASIYAGLSQLPAVNKALICGGGWHNDQLIRRLNTLLNCPVESTEAHGVHPDWVEAVAFAWLAQQTMQGKPGNIPSVTGAKKSVVLGAIYQGIPS
ncbi:MAG: anhydro-N-acetylmuramic acid kinase [Cycloclasticus sp.]|nr:anhydro-N-acetylmuramic acid kinase [Cycloclasticus sp.]MBQ0790334.1 anhydro-N-acetylmuramic acid kinase [Cycloclasticus sp.]